MHSSQPAFFKQGPKPLTRLTVFALLSLMLMVGDAHYRMLGRVREQVSVALYPLQWLATMPFTLAQHAGSFFTRQAELLNENRQLNNARLSAATQTMQLKQLEAENAHLRELTQARRSLPKPSQLAEVLYTGRDPFTARLIVDRGSRQNAIEGSIVTDQAGLVGQIVRVQPLTSEVRLISDRDHLVPVMVARNQLRTVVYGMGRQQPLEVRNMSRNVDIQPGDTLVTSGIDGLYPAGLPVAKVTQVDRQPAFARVLCAPIAAIDQHRFLLILDPAAKLPPYPEIASAPAGNTPVKGR